MRPSLCFSTPVRCLIKQKVKQNNTTQNKTKQNKTTSQKRQHNTRRLKTVEKHRRTLFIINFSFSTSCWFNGRLKSYLHPVLRSFFQTSFRSNKVVYVNKMEMPRFKLSKHFLMNFQLFLQIRLWFTLFKKWTSLC